MDYRPQSAFTLRVPLTHIDKIPFQISREIRENAVCKFGEIGDCDAWDFPIHLATVVSDIALSLALANVPHMLTFSPKGGA